MSNKIEKKGLKELKNRCNKRIFSIMALAFFILIILSFSIGTVSGTEYGLVCLGKGEKVKFSQCNPGIRDYTCTSTSCNVCASVCSNGAYGPASPNKCNSLGLSCTYLEGAVDSEPSILSILSPGQGKIYNTKALLLNLEVDEVVSIYYAYPDSRGRWSPICNKCTSYGGKRSFREGANNITFRTRDLVGNTAFFNLSFIIDSQKPRIAKTLPSGGFAASDYYLEFKEANPKSLILYYGNDISGRKSLPFNINSDCVQNPVDKTRYSCSRHVNDEEYDSETIEYYFNLTDIAGNSFKSRVIKLKIDTSPPEINSIEYIIKKRAVKLTLDITEPNFDVAEYRDNSALRPSWKKLCTSLNNGICKKILTFSPGHHELDIQVVDDAGNSVGQSIEFDIL
ncbi:hypothetical protein HYW75_03330 [Candidatus Pacearchaeota archaeon]|nr:hypothetical protein [Candidatus Pacearchaeota archaeon]